MARLSTETAHRRARIARLTQSYPADHPALVSARRDLKEHRLAEYIDRVLSEAPPLTEEQRTRLAELLRPARRIGGA